MKRINDPGQVEHPTCDEDTRAFCTERERLAALDLDARPGIQRVLARIKSIVVQRRKRPQA